jgi:glycosyltransferase involved in cell wall biosynthesis
MNPLVSLIIPMHEDYPIVIPSMIAQTYKNWEIILVHDGPCCGDDEREIARYIGDERVRLFEIPGPCGDWGHCARAEGLKHVNGELVVFGGADNYYMPNFLNEMVEHFNNPDTMCAYCNCVHNIRSWEKMDCRPALGLIDCGCFMVRSEIAKKIGWKSRVYEADWIFIQEVFRDYCKMPSNIVKVNKVLFCHN